MSGPKRVLKGLVNTRVQLYQKAWPMLSCYRSVKSLGHKYSQSSPSRCYNAWPSFNCRIPAGHIPLPEASYRQLVCPSPRHRGNFGVVTHFRAAERKDSSRHRQIPEPISRYPGIGRRTYSLSGLASHPEVINFSINTRIGCQLPEPIKFDSFARGGVSRPRTPWHDRFRGKSPSLNWMARLVT